MAEKPAGNSLPHSEIDIPSGRSDVPSCKKFKLDEYEDVSETCWSYEQPDYRHIARITSDSASNWRSEEYCDQLRLAKRLQSKNLWLPSFLNGTTSSRPRTSGGPRQANTRARHGNATQHSERVTALEYLISTVTKAMRNGNTNFVFGPLHPKQRYKALLKLPRKSGFSNNYDLEDYLSLEPLCYLPTLPDY